MRLRFVCSALFLVLAETTAAQTPPAQDKLLQGRAAEAVIWAMPAVNTDMMLQAALKAGTKANEIVYWSRPVDWRNQTLTPNPDAIYLMPFFDTKDGPVVIEGAAVPDGSFTANIDDIWQMALEDAGPSGADKGAGGKYLLLPPGYPGRHPRQPRHVVLDARVRSRCGPVGRLAGRRSALHVPSGRQRGPMDDDGSATPGT